MSRIRPDGGITGSINNPNGASASGMWSLKDHERSTRGSIWPTAFVGGEPYFNLNSLLLHGDGGNGANNTVFVDSSTNAYTVTMSGKPPQGTFSPFSQTGWSNYFNGSTDYISTPTPGTNFQFGTNNWTIEAWFFPTSSGTAQTLFQIYGTTNDNINIQFNGTTKAPFCDIRATNQTAVTATSTVLANLNQWNHIVVTRDSTTTIKIYVNGSLGVTQAIASTTTFVDTQFASNPTIGAKTNTVGQYFSGYISNLRVVSGTALYSSTFTPPTTQLTAVSGTVLLTCQDNRFKDSSTVALSLTPNGTPSVLPFEPFAPGTAYTSAAIGGSAYFNGSSDYLTLPNNMTVLGSSAYTLEGWFYPTTVSAGEIPLVKLYNSTQTVELRIVSSKIQGRINGSATIVGGNTTLYPNQWYHFALVKPTSGTSTAVLYINGVAEATTASDTTTYTAFTTPRIGANQTPSFYFTGYASNVRVLNGVAQYTGNFTPPTAPFTNISGTLALMNFTNAGIIDNAAKINLTTYGTASISSTQSKFGGTSISLNGSSDYVQFKPGFIVPQNSAYTFECWFYLNNTTFSTYYTLLGQSAGGTSGALNIRITSTTAVSVDQLGLSAQSFTIPTLSSGQWYHIAVTRNTSNGTDVWLDGVKSTTGTVTLDKNYGGTTDIIGANNDSGLGKYFPGYIDDVRFTIGYSRYTIAFTPTTTAFQDQ